MLKDNIKLSLIDNLGKTKLPALVGFLFKNEVLDKAVIKYLPSLPKILKDAKERKEFEGEKNQNFILNLNSKNRFKKIILIGLGEKAGFKPEFFYEEAGLAVRLVQKMHFQECTFYIENLANLNLKILIPNISRGILMGAYHFYEFLTKKEKLLPPFKRIEIVLKNSKNYEPSFKEGIKIAKAINLSRYLAETPGNIATPAFLAEKTKEVFKKDKKVEVEIIEKPHLQELKMNTMLAVGSGSKNEPKLIVIKYLNNPQSKNQIVFIGKGLTFDAGGISLKPSEKMEEMKYDMSAGATVIAALKAIQDLNLKANAVGIIPALENLPSGEAIRPGDILTTASGKTIEVINTDAEGRMVLADALWYAQKFFNPQIMIDLATLTGACVVALGMHYAGFFSNDSELKKIITDVANETGEKIWELPLTQEFREQNKSSIADIKNIGKKGGGAITAAAFLEFFINKKIKWAHLDIAGTAWTTEEKTWLDKGATGFGVYLLINLVRRFSAP